MHGPFYWKRRGLSETESGLRSDVNGQEAVGIRLMVEELFAVGRPQRSPAAFGRNLILGPCRRKRLDEDLGSPTDLLGRHVCDPPSIWRKHRMFLCAVRQIKEELLACSRLRLWPRHARLPMREWLPEPRDPLRPHKADRRPTLQFRKQANPLHREAKRCAGMMGIHIWGSPILEPDRRSSGCPPDVHSADHQQISTTPNGMYQTSRTASHPRAIRSSTSWNPILLQVALGQLSLFAIQSHIR